MAEKQILENEKVCSKEAFFVADHIIRNYKGTVFDLLYRTLHEIEDRKTSLEQLVEQSSLRLTEDKKRQTVKIIQHALHICDNIGIGDALDTPAGNLTLLVVSFMLKSDKLVYRLLGKHTKTTLRLGTGGQYGLRRQIKHPMQYLSRKEITEREKKKKMEEEKQVIDGILAKIKASENAGKKPERFVHIPSQYVYLFLKDGTINEDFVGKAKTACGYTWSRDIFTLELQDIGGEYYLCIGKTYKQSW